MSLRALATPKCTLNATPTRHMRKALSLCMRVWVCVCVFVHKVGTKCLKDYLQIKSFDC